MIFEIFLDFVLNSICKNLFKPFLDIESIILLFCVIYTFFTFFSPKRGGALMVFVHGYFWYFFCRFLLWSQILLFYCYFLGLYVGRHLFVCTFTPLIKVINWVLTLRESGIGFIFIQKFKILKAGIFVRSSLGMFTVIFGALFILIFFDDFFQLFDFIIFLRKITTKFIRLILFYFKLPPGFLHLYW